LNKNKLLLTIALLFFILTGKQYLPTARQFTGYRLWQEAEPYIAVNLSFKTVVPDIITLILSCPGADAMKISNDPDFPQAKWLKYKEKKNWRLDSEKKLITVYAVFKRKNNNNNRNEISPMVSYTFKKTAPYKKLDKYRNGYIDWTEGSIVIEATAAKKRSGNNRYTINNAQEKAENLLYEYCYDILKSLPLNSFYTIQDYIKKQQSSTLFSKYIFNLKLQELKYIDKETVYVKGELPFLYPDQDQGLPRLLHIKETIKTNKIKTVYHSFFKGLVLDVRNYHFSPYLYPRIVDEKGEVIISTAFYTNYNVMFARYLRYNATNYTKETNNNILYIKAFDISAENKSSIVISKRYKSLLTANQKTVYSICNGNFYLLID